MNQPNFLDPRSAQPDSPASAATHLRFIDGVRGLAVAWVLLYHSWSFSGRPAPGVWNPLASTVGVNLFLVLSGFCLYFGIVSRPERPLPDWKQYARRRFRRIYPPYFVALTFYAACALVMISLGRGWIEGPNSILALVKTYLVHLTLLHTYTHDAKAINHPLWTIGLEASFYVAFPFLVLITGKIGIWRTLFFIVLAPVVLKGLILSLNLDPKTPGHPGAEIVAFYFFSRRLIEFGLGMLGAYLIASGKKMATWLPLLSTSVLLFFGVKWLNIAFTAWSDISDALLGLSSLLLILAIYSSKHAGGTDILHRLFASKIMVGLGLISYSVYLIHQPILRYVISMLENLEVGVPLRFMLSVGFAIPLILMLARPFFEKIEKPFHNSNRSL